MYTAITALTLWPLVALFAIYATAVIASLLLRGFYPAAVWTQFPEYLTGVVALLLANAMSQVVGMTVSSMPHDELMSMFFFNAIGCGAFIYFVAWLCVVMGKPIYHIVVRKK